MRAEAKVRGLESMAKTDNAEGGGDHHHYHRWGTWEELLLACAVNRHGTKSWEAVAVEVQSRTSSPLLLNAQNCRQKYYDLKRRFSAADSKSNGGDGDSDRGAEATVPLLEELRKLRVAELRREVQRSDLSIVSLQQKVTKLEKERERRVTEKESGGERSDLEKGRRVGDGEEENRGSEKSTPENGAAKRAGGEESDRENRSFNESNSTETKGKNGDVTVEPEAKSEKPAGAAAGGDPDPASASANPAGGEGSYNGSSDTTAKPPAPPAVALEGGESGEFRESVAESKGGGGEEGAKESSDVQSSASLSRQRLLKAVSGSSSGDEASPETEALSPASKRVPLKSQRLDRLARVMEAVRSHRHGSVFEHRLGSQETPVYQKLIRRHLDLDTIRTKLDEGLYSNSSLEFFRDLLLLFNNALVFFPKNSPESLAAAELRHLVSKDIASSRPTPPPRPKPKPKPLLTTLKPPQPDQPLPSKKPPPLPPQPQPPPKPASNLNETAAPSRPLVACRKRSSISAKPSKPVPPEPKAAPERKEPDGPPAAPSKQRTGERSASRTRAARGNKGGGGNKLGLLSESSPEPKVENAVTKKPGVAGFLNRMKRSSPSLLDSLKEATNQNSTGGNRGRGEQKKVATKREQGGGRFHGSSSRQAQEHSSQGRRSVGRPPKRAAAPAPAASRKAREAAEADAKPPRKRVKR